MRLGYPRFWTAEGEEEGENGDGSGGVAGGETHRGRKLCLEEIKPGTCPQLEERKAVVTSLGDGLQEEKAWDFTPSRR